MRGKVLIVIAALVVGGIAAFATFGYLGSLQREAAAGDQLVQVYVATQNIARGVTAADLTANNLVEQVQMPRRYVAEGALTSVNGLSNRVLAAPVSKGEVLTTGRFQYASQAGLAFSVPKGYVAVTIPVDDARGVAGLLNPGDHVAVFATVAKSSVRDQETRIIVPGVLVLAVGQNTDSLGQSPAPSTTQAGGVLNSGQDDSAKGTTSIVTVAISTAEAEKVVFAVEAGSVWLGLLPGTSTTVSPGKGQTSSTVFR